MCNLLRINDAHTAMFRLICSCYSSRRRRTKKPNTTLLKKTTNPIYDPQQLQIINCDNFNRSHYIDDDNDIKINDITGEDKSFNETNDIYEDIYIKEAAIINEDINIKDDIICENIKDICDNTLNTNDTDDNESCLLDFAQIDKDIKQQIHQQHNDNNNDDANNDNVSICDIYLKTFIEKIKLI